MEHCKKCECNCRLISASCLQKHTVFDDPSVVGTDNYTKATHDLDSLIGFDCARELCQALKDAANLAESNPGTTIEDYLEQKWSDLVKDNYFKSWYANRVAFHFFKGCSIGELKEIGIIFNSGQDSMGNSYNSGKDASAERQRLEKESENYSQTARTRFLQYFWQPKKHYYKCADEDCGCDGNNTTPRPKPTLLQITV